MECNRLQEHYEAYAIGALEGEERTEIQAHLARGCPVCAPGVESARSVVAQLAYLAPEATPPARVRNKLLAAVEQPRPRRNWFAAAAWATAAVLLVVALLIQQRAGDLETRLAELQRQYQELAAENERYHQMLSIISSAGTRAVSLAAPDSPQIQAYWNEPLGLVLAGRNVPLPSPNRTYQLWIVPKQGDPISVDLFRPDETGQALLVSSPSTPIADAAALAVTDEPGGGSPQPTTQPIWVGPLG